MGGYDFVVIGAGSGGCAVAGRLASAGHTVLLLEAGGSDRRFLLQAPLGYGAALGGRHDWKYLTEPEPGCNDRRLRQPRGKTIGGTSSINAMLWVRGCRADYDEWQLPGWAWDDVEPVFRRIESHFLGAPTHGTSGPMHVTRLAEPNVLSERFVAAARAAGVAASDDIGGPDLDGVSIAPVTIWKGRRWNSARGYLDPAGDRLSVVTEALVHRVVIRDGRAVGVEYERRGMRSTVTANREIVLSAGAYGTPQLLQLSGVGPAEHLRDIGVQPVVDSPLVGANLADHASTFMHWELAPGFHGLRELTNPKWLVRWLVRHTGLWASNAAEAVAHIRSQPGLTAPDFQLICVPIFTSADIGGRLPRAALTLGQSYWTPASRGTVMAVCGDPKVAPAIQFNTVTDRNDLDAFARAIRRTREIAASQPLASTLVRELDPGPDIVSDDQLHQWIRSSIGSTYHPASTVAMGTEPDSPLDDKLRVRGVAGLRVADASALPRIPRANTNAPAIMVGERCADFLRSECGRP